MAVARRGQRLLPDADAIHDLDESRIRVQAVEDGILRNEAESRRPLLQRLVQALHRVVVVAQPGINGSDVDRRYV